MLRAIATLASCPDPELFTKIAEGLTAIHENASRLSAGKMDVVNAGNLRAARILQAVEEEEAAKYLILLDAVRCPRAPIGRLSRHLNKFYSHLAKGLYAEVCNWRPVNFKEVREGVEQQYDRYYLDGPNNVDWIFRNWIISQREEAFYVDYVRNDGSTEWISPQRYEMIDSAVFYREPPAVMRLVTTLQASGFASPAALRNLAVIWRKFPLTDSTHIDELEVKNAETVKSVGSLSRDCITPAAAAEITTRWPFPLYDLDMREREVKEAQLRAIQERWQPE